MKHKFKPIVIPDKLYAPKIVHEWDILRKEFNCTIRTTTLPGRGFLPVYSNLDDLVKDFPKTPFYEWDTKKTP